MTMKPDWKDAPKREKWEVIEDGDLVSVPYWTFFWRESPSDEGRLRYTMNKSSAPPGASVDVVIVKSSLYYSHSGQEAVRELIERKLRALKENAKRTRTLEPPND